MQRIFTTRTELEAHDARLFLESHGIHAIVVGENTAFTNFSFTPSSEPAVVVDDADVESAHELLRTRFDTSSAATAPVDWTCKACGEYSGDAFDLCWNCDEPRPSKIYVPISAPQADHNPIVAAEAPFVEEASPPPEPSISDRRAWGEVALLVTITLPWPLSGWLYEQLDRAANASTFVGQSMSGLIMELLWASCAMAIVMCSGERWSRFGFRPLQLLYTLFGTGVLNIVTAFAVTMSNGLFHDFARGWLSYATYHALFQQSTDWISPRGGVDALFLLGYALCIGFAEELIFRGILIPRFEQLLKSTCLSVIVTSLLFSSIHWNQGPLSAWNALGVGLIFGLVFAHFRNLWPLVFAHALIDFIVILRSGTEEF